MCKMDAAGSYRESPKVQHTAVGGRVIHPHCYTPHSDTLCRETCPCSVAFAAWPKGLLTGPSCRELVASLP